MVSLDCCLAAVVTARFAIGAFISVPPYSTGLRRKLAGELLLPQTLDYCLWLEETKRRREPRQSWPIHCAKPKPSPRRVTRKNQG